MTKNAQSPPPKQVVILAYDQLCTFEFGLSVEIFATPRPEIENWYTCKTIAVEEGPLQAAGGLVVQCDSHIKDIGTADLIIIPGWPTNKKPSDELLVQMLTAHHRGATFMAICSGAFLLAELGLTQDKTITTHWRYIEALKARAPTALVEENVLYCTDNKILSSAGSAAGIDLALHVIRQDFGTNVANIIAQRLVLPAHREGGQRQFVPRPVAQPSKGPLAQLLDHVRTTLDLNWSIKSMAAHAVMSERTLIRRFAQTTGQSPAQWLTTERIYFARELLEKADLSIEHIAARSGFKTPETLRHHFRNKLKISPSDYRRQFNAGTAA
ncbi:helix-turn-helix domain-containing protein [Maritalea porphyrae]|uniref:helix-turn-helix domain-containing protein n=1 Tax=Maritalea porphyrae TaxID=880732 RepID=UPI0022B05261|nr:helix-turn-helix domain-containing protein [Maritalea porphyrae]MCZ4273876.1 helix-turn-helix domain-containing protein [Maritalea porphyrae]